MNWYYALNGQQVGPVGEYDLQTLAQSGTINGTTLVWREGLADWQPLAAAMPDYNAAEAPLIQGVAIPPAQKDLYVQQMREGVSTGLPGTVEFAGFWIRVVAKIIDGIVLMIPQFIIQGVLAMIIPGFVTMESGAEPTPEQMAAFFTSFGVLMAVVIGLNAAYYGLMVAKYGATLGKMAVGLKVINEDRSPVSLGRAIGRFFAELLSAMTCYIGYIMIAFDSEKRSLHDHICSTRVIKSR
jgi:uncharacterized RDD family membrane protein YckC